LVSLARFAFDEGAALLGGTQAHVWLAVDLKPVTLKSELDVLWLPVLVKLACEQHHRRFLPVEVDCVRCVASDDRPRRFAWRPSPTDDGLGHHVRCTTVLLARNEQVYIHFKFNLISILVHYSFNREQS